MVVRALSMPNDCNLQSSNCKFAIVILQFAIPAMADPSTFPSTQRYLLASLFLCGLIAVPLALWAQTKSKVVKRAQPPKFDKVEGFYNDAFAEGLVGERPANLSQAVAVAAANSATSVSSSPAGVGSAPAVGLAGSGWAALISAATIEDEVKALKLSVDQGVTTPSDFAGKGHKATRRDLSMLAMLFGIAGEYDGDVRWKKDAPAARDAFGRTAANAKVGTAQVFQEAKVRKEELQDLVGGGNPFSGKEAETKATWKEVCNRAPLMQHLESIWEPRLKPLLTDGSKFTANAAKVQHDAEIIAAMGAVLSKEGMADADSDEYKAFCAKLRDGAKAIIDGVKTKNFDSAAQGSATISKACTECHENYRS
jgi:cytochrome c556